MRNRILVSAFLIVGYVVASSASCGSSTGSGGGSAGTGGSSGSKGASGTKGTSGTKGSSGSGGTAGSGNSCKDQDAATAGLTGLSAACETCIAETSCSQFEACESTPGCIPGVNCIIACYNKGNTLIECGMTCGGADASATLTSVVTTAVLAAAENCGTTTTCNPMGLTKDAGGGG
jgi:hypothetical protein